MTIGMWLPTELGIPWESYGNGNKTPTWEYEWEGVGMSVDGNWNDPYFHWENPTFWSTCTVCAIPL